MDDDKNYAFIGDLQIVEEAASACASFGEFADNMIERVAMEISAAEDSFDDFPDSADYGEAWEECSSSWKDLCRLKARAAIKAMREPGDSMLEAALKADIDPEGMDITPYADVWQAMIDAALNEDGNG